jgi:hypothetical protein
LTVALLGGVLALPAARAQAPAPPPAPATPAPAVRPNFADLGTDLPAALPSAEAPAPAGGWEPEFLRSLPRPPDQPRSLFAPALPLAPPPDLERPYFELDPILDPPQWPQPGWFANVQIGLIHPHVVNGMTGIVPGISSRSGSPVLVSLQNAGLNWTVAPLFEVGYRLPAGFGEFALANRFFNAQGTDTILLMNGPATRMSRLSVNYTDLVYSSREYTAWANWSMKWRAGVRGAYTYIATRVEEPFDRAAAGTGVVAARQTSTSLGAGPYYGVELDRRLAQTGFTFVTRFDAADVFSRFRQRIGAATTTLTPTGQPTRGFGSGDFWNIVPIVNAQIGLGWQPPRYPNASLYVGYVFEYWWNALSNSNTHVQTHQGDHGEFFNQGVVFQAGVNY